MVDKEYGLFLLERAKTNKYGELLIQKFEILIEDYIEEKYIYNTEEEQLKHREVMESKGYKCYQCGTEILYENPDKIINADSTFFKRGTRVPTSIFGINQNGLLHDARVYYRHRDKTTI